MKRIASNLHAQACQKCGLMHAGLSVFSDSACQVKFLVLHDVGTALMGCRWHRPKIEAPNKLVPSSYLCRNLLSLRMMLCSGQVSEKSLTRPTLGVSITSVSILSILQRLPSYAKVLKATMWSMPQLRWQSFKCSLSSHLTTVTTLPTKKIQKTTKNCEIMCFSSCFSVNSQLTPFCFSPSTPSSDSLGQSEFSRFFFPVHDIPWTFDSTEPFRNFAVFHVISFRLSKESGKRAAVCNCIDKAAQLLKKNR